MNNKIILLFVFFALIKMTPHAQGVAVNETGANPNSHAMLDVDATSNNKGILIPRITSGQRSGIGGLGVVDEGLTVYDETTNSYWLWDGTAWVEFMMAGKAWELNGNGGTTAGTNFIGTTDAIDWVVKTNNTERMRILSGGNVGIGTAAPADKLVVTGGRIEFTNTNDATGTAGSGVLEIGNSLRMDGNEIITNTNAVLYINNDNEGDVSMDGGTFFLDASTNRIGVGTGAPSTTLDVNGTVRIRGGGPAAGDFLMSQDANGNAVWARDGYGLVPIGSIIGWHGNLSGVPGLPTGWLECNGQIVSDAASPLNGVTLPDLNGNTTSRSGDASRGRFLRGSTVSGSYQGDQSNNLEWVNHDDSGNGDTDDYLTESGTTITIRNYSTDGDRFQLHLEGIETRVTNMTVRWIIRVK